MSKKKRSNYKKARIDSDHSFFEKYPSITVSRYWIPNKYADAVDLTIKLFKSDIPFNKAVDQASAAYPDTNRNKLAEHTLKFIANQF